MSIPTGNATLSLLTVVASGVLGAIAAVLTAAYKSQSDIRKIRTELRHSYEKFLFEKRFDRYPELYSLISSYAKILRYGKPDGDTFRAFLTAFDNWDTQHGWLLGNQSTEMAWLTQQYLHLLERENKSTLASERELIIKAITALESRIKAEIGAFGTDIAGRYKRSDSIRLLNNKIRSLSEHTHSS